MRSRLDRGSLPWLSGFLARRQAALFLLMLSVLLCHGVLGIMHQPSSHQNPPVAAQASEHGESHAGSGAHGGEPSSVEHGLGGSYYAAALILLALSGLATAASFRKILVSALRAGPPPATRWFVRPRLRPPPAPTGAYLQVFRL